MPAKLERQATFSELARLDRADRKTFLAQIVHQPLEMRGIARLALDIGEQPLGRQGSEDTLVRDFDDVDLMLVEQARDMKKGAGAVL